MTNYTVMTYNIEHMNGLFTNNQVKEDMKHRATKIAEVIREICPHILGICEAANSRAEHAHFISNYLPDLSYQVALGKSRGSQNLVIYYREPFSVLSIDDAYAFYDPWSIDIDRSGITEQFRWERKPLEVVFQVGSAGPTLRVLLVHAKSKAIYTVADLATFQKISLANRKRLVAQAMRLRERLDQLIAAPNPLPLLVLGDMNDGPGLDPFETIIGKSFVETAMGSVFNPNGIFHNTLWYMTKDAQLRKNLWTADFPDPIVNHPLGYKHRVWIDHILVSQDMLSANNAIKYTLNSGQIGQKTQDSRIASDHFAVYCTIEIK